MKPIEVYELAVGTVEVYELAVGTVEGTHLYGGWYQLVGEIVSSPKAEP